MNRRRRIIAGTVNPGPRAVQPVRNVGKNKRNRGRAPVDALEERFTDVIVVRPTTAPTSSYKRNRAALEPNDVIDLGAPRLLRTVQPVGLRNARPNLHRPSYIPNPRLYPGPVHNKPRAQAKQVDSRGGGEGRGRRRKRAARRVVPNPRLYQPAPPVVRREPPPAYPKAAWSPLEPAARLDTASHVALRVSEQRRGRPGPPPSRALSAKPAPPLVVTLPPVDDAAPRYRPASAHFQLRSLDTDSGHSTPVVGRPDRSTFVLKMDAGNRKSTSPEDCSEGNETLSAPSEFLAEFLSAIMRRQYAEALKYCRLILQYEPHNATARGFYPLLQQKVQAQKRPDAEGPRGSSSEEASAPAADAHTFASVPHKNHEMMEQGGDSSEESEGSEGDEGAASHSLSHSGDSCRSQSSLELDSSEALGHSSPSLSLSRRTERTDSASAGVWDSTGSASRSDTDDNGNATFVTAPAGPAAHLCAGDLQNDNTPGVTEPPAVAHHKAELSALQRLRAQFTCSIK